MTKPIEAYRQGVQARADHPDAKSWEGLLPYATTPLTHAWLDGWYSRFDPSLFCPECWSSAGLTDLPDGTLRCKTFPCRDRNWPPVDKQKIDEFFARRDSGSGI